MRSRRIAVVVTVVLAGLSSSHTWAQNYIVEALGQNSGSYQEVSGTWATSSSKSYASGTTSTRSSRYASTTQGAVARWSFTPSIAGLYDVYMTMPPTANVTGNPVIYTVTHSGSDVIKNVQQNNGGGSNDAWLKLNTTPLLLLAGNLYTITQTETTSTGMPRQRADAVKWELVATDADSDGVYSDLDNCAAVANPGQEDADSDGQGNDCDVCSNVWVDPLSGQSLNGAVMALGTFDTGSGEVLYVGGGFTAAGGSPISHIGWWTGTEGGSLAAGLNDSVRALAAFDADGAGPDPLAIYAGGDFTLSGALSLSRIAKWNGTAWSALGSGLNGSVYALAVFDDDGTGPNSPALYVAGQFTSAGGVTVSNIAKWNGTTWSVAGTLNDTVRTLAVFDADGAGPNLPALHAGGSFTLSGPNGHATCVGRWDGASWVAVGYVDAAVHAMVVWDDDGSGPNPSGLYAAGEFLAASGMPVNRIARWDGANWFALGTGLNGTAKALTVFDDSAGASLHASGTFTQAGGASAAKVARWDGLHWSGVGWTGSGEVSALCGFSDAGAPALFIGGAFTIGTGSPSDYLATWRGCLDGDGDGIPDTEDNCPQVANADQADADSDNVGDLCDNCGEVSNTDQADADSDEIGDACDLCTDSDGDGFGDPGFPVNICLLDNCPNLASPDQDDCDTDGKGDVCTIAEGDDEDCNSNGVPDACDLAGDSDDCNSNGIPDECEPDCNGNYVPDDCDIDPGDPDGNLEVSPDCNANETPDECELASSDCNLNEVPDDCDLDPADPDGNGEVSLDCNSNGIPDECDLASDDCNGNGIPDECDLVTAFSQDENSDGVPDECEAVIFRDDFEAYANTVDFEKVWSKDGSPFYYFDPAFGKDSGKSVRMPPDDGSGGGTTNRWFRDLCKTFKPVGSEKLVFSFDMYLPASGAPDWLNANHAADLRGYTGEGYKQGDLIDLVGIGVNHASGDTYSTHHFQGRVFGLPSNGYRTLDDNPATPLRSTGWHHLQATIKPLEIQFYVDGVFAESVSRTLGLGINALILGSGLNAYGHTVWVDNVRLDWVRQSALLRNVTLVDAEAPAGGNGYSWATAYNDLQAAIAAASVDTCPTTEIWVAEGTYLPSALIDPQDPRSATFKLQNGLAIYGGFAGTEELWSQRNPAAHETVLTNDPNNSRYVVTLEDTDQTAVLDGFTIRSGDAPGLSASEFRVEGGATISNNAVYTEGNHYLDLDPDAEHPNSVILHNNRLYVETPRDTSICAAAGSSLELRSADLDCTSGCGSGLVQLPNLSDFDFPAEAANNWVFESLTVKAGVRLNLTNRDGFKFQLPTEPEVLYVRNLTIEAGAILNTGLQRVYYHTLDNQNPTGGTTENPLLGFSLINIDMNCQEEFDIRLAKQTTAGTVTRILADPYGQVPMPPSAGGVADLETHSDDAILVKGTFAPTASDEPIRIVFQYLFLSDGDADDADLEVSVSDDPRAGLLSNISVAHVRPPTAGAAGAIGSGRFGLFQMEVYEPTLNFTRGTYVQLTLHGQNARVWIDNFDPAVICSYTCADYTKNGVSEDDFLILLAEYGRTLGASDAKACLDSKLSWDSYVDMADLLNWETYAAGGFYSCYTGGATAMASPATEVLTESQQVPFGLLVSAKQNVPGEGESADQSDFLYTIADDGTCTASSVPPAGGEATRASGRLLRDLDGKVYQLHGTRGLVRLEDETVIVGPRTDLTWGEGENQVTAIVGVTPGEDFLFTGLPITDAAFSPTDATILYVAPVLVAVPAGVNPAHTYKAVARLKLDVGSPGVYSLDTTSPAPPLYGMDPWLDPNANTSTPPETSTYNVQKLRELEIDRTGGWLYVAAAQAGENNNQWLLVYNIATGAETRILLTDPGLSPALTATTSMLVSSREDKLYLTSSAGGACKLYRLSISGAGATFDGELDLSNAETTDMRQITAIAENPADGKLYLLGFQFPEEIIELPEDLSQNDPLFWQYFGGQAPAPAIWTLPRLTTVQPAANWTESTKQVVTLSSSNLALPIAAVMNPEVVRISTWRSVREHTGIVDPLSIELDADASGNGAAGPTVETRSGGIQRIEVDFSGAVDSLPHPENVTVMSGATSYPPESIQLSGDKLKLIITFPAAPAPGHLPDGQCYTITIASGTLSPDLADDADVSVRALLGDVNVNGTVNLGDALYVKSRIGQAVDATTAQFDVDRDGTISDLDVAAVIPLVTLPARQAECP